MTSDELHSSVRVTLAALGLLTLLIIVGWAGGNLSARAAHGALAGLSVAAAVLATGYIVGTRVRGGPA